MSFRFRAQLIIALIIIAVSSAFTYYHVSTQMRYADERSLRSSENVKMAFDTIVRDIEHFYVFRAYANIRSEGVAKAIKERDTQTLYRLTLPRYKTLTEENPSLTIMQFHASDGRSIVRMHLKEKFGDNIAEMRPMLREVHLNHKMMTGFEGGLGGMAYRVIMPVFDNDTYIGALEFGIDSTYFIDKLKQMTGCQSLLMIHQNLLGAMDESLYQNRYGDYRYGVLEGGDKAIVDAFADKNLQMEPKNLRFGEKDYEIHSLFLQDADHKNVGAIICIYDVTGVFQNTLETVIGSSLLTALLVLVFWGVFQYFLGSLIGKVNLQERYIHTILNSQKNIVIVTDGVDIIYANQPFFDYFSYPTLEKFREEHLCMCDFFESGESNEYLLGSNEGVSWIDYLSQYNQHEHKVKMTLNAKTSIFTVHSQKMEYDHKIRHVVVFTDITKLNELATLDPLTQVFNRFQFDRVLSHSITLAERYGRSLSILLIDIDFFKKVNDSYGHLVGDEVLKTMARILSESIRKSDILARWGGEEFVILLPDSDLSSAIKIAEYLRQNVEKSDFLPVDKVTCSIGVARWNEGESPDQLLRRVDEKLYQAKEAGRNLVVS